MCFVGQSHWWLWSYSLVNWPNLSLRCRTNSWGMEMYRDSSQKAGAEAQDNSLGKIIIMEILTLKTITFACSYSSWSIWTATWCTGSLSADVCRHFQYWISSGCSECYAYSYLGCCYTYLCGCFLHCWRSAASILNGNGCECSKNAYCSRFRRPRIFDGGIAVWPLGS